MSSNYISQCCGARVEVGGDGVTHFFVCYQCNKACDVTTLHATQHKLGEPIDGQIGIDVHQKEKNAYTRVYCGLRKQIELCGRHFAWLQLSHGMWEAACEVDRNLIVTAYSADPEQAVKEVFKLLLEKMDEIGGDNV